LTDLNFFHSVLVHSGGVHGGHYYAFIRPTLSEQWYVYTRITRSELFSAIQARCFCAFVMMTTRGHIPTCLNVDFAAFIVMVHRILPKCTITDKIECTCDKHDIEGKYPVKDSIIT